MDMITDDTRQAKRPSFISSATSKYPVPKYSVFTLECGGSVIVYAIPKEHAIAIGIGFIPKV